ncbi:hypothetical protein FGG08_003919 [Glutinoglossum americanum]|uniref:Uncharacterized protein n=1 Tax=Glutinoglossum americanum TaxID=1670608 RepID=A0A9P8L381_9PEZI|nr:hypothetical protein FGG08_003919 [Glutinoglossum americanum]
MPTLNMGHLSKVEATDLVASATALAETCEDTEPAPTEHFEDATSQPGPAQDCVAVMVREMDFSLLNAPTDMHDSSEAKDVARLVAPQDNATLGSPHGPDTPSSFGMKSEDMLAYQVQRQCFPGSLSFGCQCTLMATSEIAPAQSPSYWPNLECHHQTHTPQESPQEVLQGQKSAYKRGRTVSDPSGSVQVRPSRPNNQADSSVANTTDSGLEAHIPRAISVDALLGNGGSGGTLQPTLEDRFERILDVVEKAGFSSIDSMVAEYYTAKFREDTAPHSSQSLSRSRHLRRLLASLHDSIKSWSSREARGYREEIVRSAESIYVEELQQLRQKNVQEEASLRQVAVGGSESGQRAAAGEKTGQLFPSVESNPLLKHGHTLLQESVPETWSLLMELARNAGLPQPQRSQAASAFLYTLALR